MSPKATPGPSWRKRAFGLETQKPSDSDDPPPNTRSSTRDLAVATRQANKAKTADAVATFAHMEFLREPNNSTMPPTALFWPRIVVIAIVLIARCDGSRLMRC